MSLIISSKYQVVIPKAVRKQLSIKPGQKVRVSATSDGRVILEKDDTPDIEAIINKYAGTLKGVWHNQGLSAEEWLRKERDAWDEK
ncbi:AbrB/MazE/SpoVT family DNA-binding domain-containing protein [Candidatus Saccharibacteria bacterium]|nr:AbrB/MazE/SpoVT family DNA-binding domain-containing protein [Candidatus Saccharibacteria bacterium]